MVNSVFHPSEVDQMSTKNWWGPRTDEDLVDKSKRYSEDVFERIL